MSSFKQAVIDSEWPEHKEHGLLPEHVTVAPSKISHHAGGCNTCGYGGWSVTDGWETSVSAECPCERYLGSTWDGRKVAVFLAAL